MITGKIIAMAGFALLAVVKHFQGKDEVARFYWILAFVVAASL